MPLLIPATSSTTPGAGIDTSSAAASGPSSAARAQNNTIEGIEPLTITEELETFIIKTLGNQRVHTDAIVATLGNQREHTDKLVRDLRNMLTDELQGIHQALIALETRQAEYHLDQRQIQEDERNSVGPDTYNRECEWAGYRRNGMHRYNEAGEIKSDDIHTDEENEEAEEKDKEEATSSSTMEEVTEGKDKEKNKFIVEEKEEKDKEEVTSSSTTAGKEATTSS
ncbi:hypothetical protein BDB00DRAFT_876877 [Zychaea mexicana]|uniref:uncharacterized protein n=1 Tax=Zychaea mexicana TaxID=64656 RepID=UPI0022FE2162|nr:uncharacterized protein BDB00DRAFT_876877 [Zychaea mexicana]KAI9488993.1 hypothetical protein BDB00DRAFT_876877 [Zychaea mexicana]